MKRDYFKAIPAVYVILQKNGEILLLRRQNTSYYDGKLSLPAGHVEQQESLRRASTREAWEEVGVKVKESDLRLVHVMSRPNHGTDDTRLDFFFAADNWENEPINREPQKCAELVWADRFNLPKDMVPEVRQAIEYANGDIIESEFGWH